MFHVAGGGSANITVDLTVHGTENAETCASCFYTNTVELGIGGAGFVWYGSDNSGDFTQSLIAANYGWVGGAGAVSNQSQTGIDFLAQFQVTDGQDFEFDLNQGLTCANGTDCNYLHTLQFSLSLPAGVSHTSGSGVFLTQTANAAAPEPGSVILLGTALLYCGLCRFRRTPEGQGPVS